jgi:OmcA/MtrC family decaheme c-type cytochrome
MDGLEKNTPHPAIEVLQRCLATGLLALAACEGDRGPRGPAGPAAPVTPGPGLQFAISSVAIGGDLLPVVDFTLADAEGVPLELSDLDSMPRFALGWIEVDSATGLSRYQSYVVTLRTGLNYVFNGMPTAPALPSALQAGTDSGGTFETIAPGEFRYTFNTALPAGFDAQATHTLAAFASRENRTVVENPVHHFVPAGGPVAVTRDVVRTANCNECHDPLALHGGVRQEVGLCVLCHTDQSIDPESGNSVEFKEMVHKIHRGDDLSNLPYYIVGFGQSVHDYSEVVFPQEVRHCTKCHKDGADSDNWKTRPSRVACGACHDDVDWASGFNHGGGPQTDDTMCSSCHPAEMVLGEFDLSVTGAHVVPYESSANPNLSLAITDVQDLTPGNTPTLSFTIESDAGPVDILTLNRVAVVFAGPTDEYLQLMSTGNSFTIRGGGATGTLVTNGIGDYTYTPPLTYTIPPTASGTWSVGMEARTQSTLVGGVNVSFGANNPVVDVDLAVGILGGGTPAPRRQVVEESNCNACHGDLRIHGNLRTEIPYCVMCHNPWTTDELRRPMLDPATNPPETVHFKVMIHKIHRGEDLAGEYTVYGFGSTPFDFTEVLFPGDLRNCQKCHVDGSQLLPMAASAQATVKNIAGTPVPQPDAVRPPTLAACTACHDDEAAVIHAQLNSYVGGPFDWGEACSVCHDEGSEFAVSKVHAR